LSILAMPAVLVHVPIAVLRFTKGPAGSDSKLSLAASEPAAIPQQSMKARPSFRPMRADTLTAFDDSLDTPSEADVFVADTARAHR